MTDQPIRVCAPCPRCEHTLNPDGTCYQGCPTSCDEDCDTPCHESHAVPHKRDHEPSHCPAPAGLRPRRERCPDPECTDANQCWRCDYEESQHVPTARDAEMEQLRETNQRLNRRTQAAESELATYRRAVSQWDISERGTYIPLRTLRTIGKAAGKDILGSVRHLEHFQRVEEAEAAVERVRKAITERRTEVAEFETENPPSAWSDGVTVTCNRVEDALRVLPPSVGIPDPDPALDQPAGEGK